MSQIRIPGRKKELSAAGRVLFSDLEGADFCFVLYGGTFCGKGKIRELIGIGNNQDTVC